jgi:hypothetical protein
MDNRDHRRRMPAGLASGFKTDGPQDGVETTTQESRPGEAVAGASGQNGVSNVTYRTQRHNFSDREASPSTGWRGVYRAMGVDVR